ncbi:filamentous hemagglutinin N-terminal domain-containing protein [Phenylobacterium sp.]|jgi:filamentous hemagglutinin family protein|uniref:two-partner secretion domain-containing protein n=1 Tax=Phenylobacterium sp. TaxID=1871053 RepID=UPI002E2F16C6|nr:filamentous hemagglutinin N-terminal domain-containing protein [Phenylobacterium sp.]HEX3367348.1 filamentous hemagglutinin N-terminal domain-containing protein [Phenylobacterium sp.]
MTSSAAHRPPRRGRRDLLAQTALCGALLGFAALTTPAVALPSLGGSPQVNAGGGQPNIVTGPSELDVTLHGPRTVIDWASYNVAGGETVKYTFDSRNWIVLNRINSTDTPTVSGNIVGQVGGSFGGNIWFASKNGMIFGSGAQVDAGGILVSAATPDLAGFLDPNNLTFNFPGTEVIAQPSVVMQTGSSINGHGGLVALIAPSVVTAANTAVTGANGSSVLYGATTGYQLHLTQTVQGDLDLVDFLVPSSDAGSGAAIALDLQNTTTANSVFVAAVSRTSAASAVINLEGMVTANAATTDGGDIILSGGGGIAARAIGPTVGGSDTDFYLGTMSAVRDIRLATLGQVFGQPFTRLPPAPITVPVIPGPGCPITSNGCEVALPGALGRSETQLTHTATLLLADATDPSLLSNLTAGRDVNLVATQMIALGSATGARDVSLDGQSVQANSLAVGRTLTLRSEAGDVNAGSLALSGNGQITSSNNVAIDSLSLSGGTGQTLNVQAAADLALGSGSGAASGGSITLIAGGSVIVDLASANLTSVTAGAAADVQAGTLTVGTISAPEVLVRGGTINVGTAVSGGDIYVSSSGGSATVGTAQAGDDVYLLASGGNATLTNAILTGSGPDAVGLVIAGSPDAANNGRVVSVSSLDGNAVLGQQTGSVSGATAVSVVAGQDAIVQVATALSGALTVSAQRDATLSAPTVNFSAVQAGRDVTLMTTAGDFSSASPLVAARNLTIGASGALTVGNITATSGSIALTGRTVTAGALVAGQDLTLKATGGGVQVVSFTSGRDLTLQGSSFSLGQQLGAVGRDLSITTPGDFTAGGDLTAGRNITLNVGGVASLKGVSGPGTVDIIANDLALGGAVTAANVQVESASGALRVGGSAADGTPASGLWLDNAEFGRIRATGQVSLYAGAAAGTARGDLTVLQLDVNPAATPQVNFLVGGGHNALIQGVMAPSASGGMIQIGAPTNTVWRPTSVLVSGTIGAANFANDVYSNVRAFDHVRLFAAQDIVIGSQRFIGLIQQASIADIEIGKNRPAGVAPITAEQNRVLVAAGDLELSAPGRAVSQNTATTADRSIGLFLTGKSNPNLILDPPQLVDLYGSLLGPGGSIVSSFPAGGILSVAILDSAGNPTTAPAGSVYRFNSCTFGTNQCSAASDLTANLQQDTPNLNVSTEGDLLGDDAESAAARGAGGRNSGPPLLSNAPPDAEAVLAEPVVTGAGSEEIWRKRTPAPDKKPEAKP